MFAHGQARRDAVVSIREESNNGLYRLQLGAEINGVIVRTAKVEENRKRLRFQYASLHVYTSPAIAWIFEFIYRECHEMKLSSTTLSNIWNTCVARALW